MDSQCILSVYCIGCLYISIFQTMSISYESEVHIISEVHLLSTDLFQQTGLDYCKSALHSTELSHTESLSWMAFQCMDYMNLDFMPRSLDYMESIPWIVYYVWISLALNSVLCSQTIWRQYLGWNCMLGSAGS